MSSVHLPSKLRRASDTKIDDDRIRTARDVHRCLVYKVDGNELVKRQTGDVGKCSPWRYRQTRSRRMRGTTCSGKKLVGNL